MTKRDGIDAMSDDFPQGVAHLVPDDMRARLSSEPETLDLWRGLTALGRNEFICWVEDAKQAATRQKRIERAVEELHEGKRRPCCWVGCIHRSDKAPGRWQQAVLIEKQGKSR